MFVEVKTEDLIAEITVKVLERIKLGLPKISKEYFKPTFSEEEAAELLQMKRGKLAQIRKAGEINFRYVIEPTAKDDGRVAYTPNDILNYLRKVGVINIEEKITFEDFFCQFAAPEDSSRVLKFEKKAA